MARIMVLKFQNDRWSHCENELFGPLWDSCLETGMATIQKINTNFLVCPKDYYVKKLKDKLVGLSYGLLCKKA